MNLFKTMHFFVALMFICTVQVYGARADTAKGKTPADLSAQIRRQIERLHLSHEAQIFGAVELGGMGKKAIASVPFLINLLDNNAALQWLKDGTLIRGDKLAGAELTSPAKEAAAALGRITGMDFGDNKDKWLKWWKEQNAPAEQKTSVPEKVEKKNVSIPAEKVEKKAAVAPVKVEEKVGVTGEEDKTPGISSDIIRLIEALGDDDEKIREIASDALIKIGKPAVKPLITSLRGGDKRVREASASILGWLGDPEAKEPLTRVSMDDEDEDVRLAAEFALEMIK